METIVAIFQIDFQNSWWNLIEGFIDMGNSIPWIDVWCNTGSHEQNFQNFHRCFVVRFITFRFVYYLVGMAFSAWLGSKESVRARKWTYTQKGTHMVLVLVYFCNRSCAMHAAHMYAKSKMLGFSLRSSFCFLAQIKYIWCQLIWMQKHTHANHNKRNEIVHWSIRPLWHMHVDCAMQIDIQLFGCNGL